MCLEMNVSWSIIKGKRRRRIKLSEKGSAPSADSEVVAEFQAVLTESYIVYAMSALFAYEYIITFGQEVTIIWQRKWSIVTWVFIANRYLMYGSVIITVSPYTSQSCPPTLVISDVLGMIQYTVFAVFSALRVFAMWDRNISLFLLILGLNLAPVAINTYEFIQDTDVFFVDPIIGTYCTVNLNISDRANFNLALGARVAVIVADSLVLVLTWRKTFQNRVDAIRVGVQTPLTSLLLRDGTVYFAALLLMNITQILLKTVPTLQTISPATNVIEVVTPILISRFILNLRQIGVDENGTTEDAVGSRFSTPAFRAPTLASIVGNIGEDLHHGPEEEVNGATDEDEPEHDNIIADGEIVTSRVASQHCGCSGDREQVPGSNVSLV